MLNALTLIASLGLLADIAVHAQTDLVAAAAASGRPPECMPNKRSTIGRTGVWSRARIPNLERYCARIARAHARIEENPAAARKAAEEAEKLVAGRAAPQVILARVALANGDEMAAMKAFETALSRDKRGVEQPIAMHDLAITQWRTGKLDEALATYRVLVPRASLLPDRNQRAQVLLEAAHVAMAVAPTQPDAQRRILDEALAFLREAARDGHHRLAMDVSLSLVLALDRAGRRLQADAVLAEQRGSATWDPTTVTYVVDPDDLLVMRGLALEKHDATAARKSYRMYLDGKSGTGPYADAVRSRLAGAAPADQPKRRGR